MWIVLHLTQLVLSSATLSNEIFCIHFWSKIMLLFLHLPSIPAKWRSLLNHKDWKVVGGKRNVLLHYGDVSTPVPSGFVLCNPFKWDILWFISDQESCFFCVHAIKAKWILFLNHMNRKVVGCQHNVLVYYVDVSAPDLFGVVLCNPFKWDISWFISG